YLAAEFPVGAPGESFVHLGAAIHSVRAVAAADLPRFTELSGPLHVHLSEQPAENEASVAAYGTTPTQVLARAGVVSERLSPVHATHL
ncbi:formimidoylglutamate deiminase, partial [Acinetobacter baumannii]